MWWIVSGTAIGSALIISATMILIIVGAGPIRWIAALVILGLGIISGRRGVGGGCGLLCGVLAVISVIVVIGWNPISIALHFSAAFLLFSGGWIIGHGMFLAWLAKYTNL